MWRKRTLIFFSISNMEGCCCFLMEELLYVNLFHGLISFSRSLQRILKYFSVVYCYPLTTKILQIQGFANILSGKHFFFKVGKNSYKYPSPVSPWANQFLIIINTSAFQFLLLWFFFYMVQLFNKLHHFLVYSSKITFIINKHIHYFKILISYLGVNTCMYTWHSFCFKEWLSISPTNGASEYMLIPSVHECQRKHKIIVPKK